MHHQQRLEIRRQEAFSQRVERLRANATKRLAEEFPGGPPPCPRGKVSRAYARWQYLRYCAEHPDRRVRIEQNQKRKQYWDDPAGNNADRNERKRAKGNARHAAYVDPEHPDHAEFNAHLAAYKMRRRRRDQQCAICGTAITSGATLCRPCAGRRAARAAAIARTLKDEGVERASQARAEAQAK